MTTRAIMVVILLASSACATNSEPAEELEPTGETRERACYTIASCETHERADCGAENSDDALEWADEAMTSCGPAPTTDAAAVAYYDCIAEQCGCTGVNDAGERVCE